MSLPEVGTYIAKLVGWTVEAPPDKCPRFVALFETLQIKGTEGFEPCEAHRINGNFTLINKNEEPNEINVRALKDALGWDGASFEALDNGDWSQVEVQIVVGEEQSTADNKIYKKVKYLNPRDYAGGRSIEKADAGTIKSLDARYGAKLRAFTGAKATTSSNGKAAHTPKKASPRPGGKQGAWAVFTAAVREWNEANPGDAYTHDDQVETFKRVTQEIVDSRTPGKPLNTLDEDEWKEVTQKISENFDAGSKNLIPF